MNSAVGSGTVEGSQVGSSSNLGTQEEENVKKIVVDALKAGLPAKPWFESAPPVRRT